MIELPNQEELAEYLRLVEFTPNLYIIDDGRMMWCCEGAFQWFIIEKVADTYEEEDISSPPDENGQVPAEMYGRYKITEFYPTVYWESRQNPYERGYLSSEDAQSMIGRTVFLGAKSYQGYSFDSSAFAEEPPDYFCGTKYYQLDADNNKILMLFMKEFFLLEKAD